MASKRIVCDLDGCLVDWNTPFAKLLAKAHGEDLLPEGWEQLGHNAFPCWNWDRHYGYSEVSCELARHWMQEDHVFWYRLPALPEAQVVLDKLNGLVNADEIDLYFITQRMGARAKQSTEMWLWDRGLVSPTVIVTGNKVPVLKGLGADFFIDDRLETVIQVHKAGLPGVYLLDRPWNRVGRHDAGCPAIADDESDQVLYDYGDCVCSLRDLHVVETVQEALELEGLWISQ